MEERLNPLIFFKKHKELTRVLISLGAAIIITLIIGVWGLFDKLDGMAQDALYQQPEALSGDIIMFTIDNRMRELVTERRKIANQLRVFKVRMSKGITVHQKHISKLQREDRKLKQQQMDLFHDLKKIGVEILAKTEKPEGEDAELPQTEA